MAKVLRKEAWHTQMRDRASNSLDPPGLDPGSRPSCLFLLLLLALLDYLKNHCQDQCQGDSPYIFFKEFYDFRSSISVLNPFQVSFVSDIREESNFILLQCGYLAFPAPFIEESSHFPFYVLGTYVKD